MVATLSQCLSFVHYFVKLITLMNWGLNGYTANGSASSLTFSSAGTYTITLTVTDNDGLTHSADQTITIESSILNQGLIAYYPFDGDANDASGNGKHGTVSGATLIQDRFGNAENAYYFNGKENAVDYIQLPRSVVNGLTNITSSIWVKTTETDQSILSGANGSNDNEYTMFMRYDSGNIRQYVKGEYFDVGSVNDGQWHHIVVVRDGGSGLAAVFIDSGLVGAYEFPTGALSIEAGGLLIGREQDCLGGCFDTSQDFLGSIDDYRIYDRALTIAEIQQLYTEETSTPNIAPIASISASATTGTAPLTVALNGIDSTDSDGTIANYNWIASDGQSAVGSATSLTFDSAGDYSVTLTVTDDRGAAASSNTTITVTEPLLPVAAFTVAPLTGAAPLVVTVDATGSTRDGGSVIDYQWGVSDGQTGAGIHEDFTLTDAGNYIITLTVIGSDGGNATTTKTVSVVDSYDTSYETTARLSPQVIAAGISPTQVDYADTEFDILALVRPGVLAIDRVTFRDSATSTFALQMEPAGVLENGDELYKTTFNFERGSFGDLVMHSAWGPEDGQYNIVAYDTAEQRSHQYPDLMFGNFAEQTNTPKVTAEITYNLTKRLGPQIIIAGFSPSQLDYIDTSFDVIAIARDGVLSINAATVTQNQSPFELAMSDAGTLRNGDKVYKMTYTFQRGAFGTSTLNTIWGDQPGQFNIHAVDSAQQRSHDFPDIMFGNYPAQ